MGDQFELEQKLLIVDVKTISFLLSQENGSDVLALYFFYYKTAKLQKTNQIRATDGFCMAGLSWGKTRFRNAKRVLEQLKLVEQFKSKTEDGKWYMRISYYKPRTQQLANLANSNSSENGLVQDNSNSSEIELVRSGLQMLNKDIIKQNAYKDNKYAKLENLQDKDFEEIAEHYKVPIAFVKSKFEDMVIWAEERPGNFKLKGRNWRATLMGWVKRDALKLVQEHSRSNKPKTINVAEMVGQMADEN